MLETKVRDKNSTQLRVFQVRQFPSVSELPGRCQCISHWWKLLAVMIRQSLREGIAALPFDCCTFRFQRPGRECWAFEIAGNFWNLINFQSWLSFGNPTCLATALFEQEDFEKITTFFFLIALCANLDWLVLNGEDFAIDPTIATEGRWKTEFWFSLSFPWCRLCF